MGVAVPVFLRSPLPPSDEITLTGPEGHHAAVVRRLRVGERVDLTDGAGSVAECLVAHVRRAELDCRVLRRRTEPAPWPRLVVAQALAKADRGERAVEMLTEVGVDEVVPWAAARSVVRWDGERGGRARQRWCSIAAEAAKQSRRTHWPVVAELASTEAVAARLAAAGLAVVLHEQAPRPLGELLHGAGCPAAGARSGRSTVVPSRLSPPSRSSPLTSSSPRLPSEVVLVVGPEGGVSDSELDEFVAAGAQPARLGPTVLRTSTAGVVAAAVVLADIGRWDG